MFTKKTEDYLERIRKTRLMAEAILIILVVMLIIKIIAFAGAMLFYQKVHDDLNGAYDCIKAEWLIAQ